MSLDERVRVSRRVSARGVSGRDAGASLFVSAPTLWRGTSQQVCGLWPFAVGAGTPTVGVPLGPGLLNNATVCGDPYTWFIHNLIANPSAVLLGNPGLGKSTFARRLCIGLEARGVLPLILGDTKGEYVPLVKALGGQVVSLGPGAGSLNILDMSDAQTAIGKLRAGGHNALADRLASEVRGRRLTSLSALLAITRGVNSSGVSDREQAVVAAGLDWLDANHPGVPILADLLAVVRDAPQVVRDAAVDRGDRAKYLGVTEGLEVSLNTLVAGNKFGDTFNKQRSVSLSHDKAFVFDISGIDEAESDLKAAVLLACWSAGFAAVSVANTLYEAGLGPQRHYLLVLDELWRILQAGHSMVGLVDALTRLNRHYGVAQLMITHTLSDFASLPGEEDRTKALGFVSRAGMVVTAGLTRPEVEQLASVLRLSDAEKNLVASWKSPPGWNSEHAHPAGMGKFLIKVGERTGIPFYLQLTPAEQTINDTNTRFSEAFDATGGVK